MTWGESWGGLWGGGDVGQIDHVEAGDDRVYEQFKPAENLRALLAALNGEVNALECAAFDVKYYRAISTAVGQTLDDIGAGLDLPRFGLDDEAYRCALSVRVRALFSSGTARDALEVLSALMKDTTRARGLVEYFPAAFCLFAADPHARRDQPTSDRPTRRPRGGRVRLPRYVDDRRGFRLHFRGRLDPGGVRLLVRNRSVDRRVGVRPRDRTVKAADHAETRYQSPDVGLEPGLPNRSYPRRPDESFDPGRDRKRGPPSRRNGPDRGRALERLA